MSSTAAQLQEKIPVKEPDVPSSSSLFLWVYCICLTAISLFVVKLNTRRWSIAKNLNFGLWLSQKFCNKPPLTNNFILIILFQSFFNLSPTQVPKSLSTPMKSPNAPLPSLPAWLWLSKGAPICQVLARHCSCSLAPHLGTICLGGLHKKLLPVTTQLPGSQGYWNFLTIIRSLRGAEKPTGQKLISNIYNHQAYNLRSFDSFFICICMR